MSRSVVMTGFGGITACGKTIEESWLAIKQGQSGVGPIQVWPSSEWTYARAAEIKNLDPKTLLLDRKLIKVISKQDIYGIYAATEAVTHSGIPHHCEKTGIFVASPGNKFQQQYDFLPLFAAAKGDMKIFAEQLFSHVHPTWLLKILPNNVLAYVGIQYGFKGANQNITNHVAGGMQAIIEAMDAIRHGLVDRAVVVGYDLAFEPQGVVYYGELGTLSQTDVKSFDARADGTILGEGAGAIVLESRESAEARSATIYAELLSGATTSEGQGIFGISSDGEGLARAIHQALSEARLMPNDLGMVTAHANGNPKSDSSEAKALEQVFGDHPIPVSGFKWAIGHTVAAAGVLDTIFTVLSLRERSVPGIPTFQSLSTECQGIHVNTHASEPLSSIGLVQARSFGSLNSTLLLNVTPSNDSQPVK